MKVNLDCIPCFMGQALKSARAATDDKSLHERVLREVSRLLSDLSYTQTPPEIAHKVHAIVREVTGNPDPYKGMKESDNQLVLDMYPWLNHIVDRSEDKLYTAVKLACAGNIIDYGVPPEFNIKNTVYSVLEKDFAVDRFPEFKADLAKSHSIIYLADNAGELVFDKLLIDQFKGKQVRLVVKGGPIINDATKEDVESCGLTDKVDLDYIGNGLPETGYDRGDPEFISMLRGADLVLSKGQGNYEGLSQHQYIYFLLMAKCQLVAEDLGVEKGSIVLSKGGRK